MTNSFKCSVLAVAISTMLLTGCNTTQIKQSAANAWESTKKFVDENRAAVGAVAGAAIGYAVSGKSDRGLGILAGALVGGLLADQLGKYLDEKERAELEAYSLSQLKSNQSSTSYWESPETGSKVKVQTGDSVKTTKNVEMVKLKQVEVAPNISLIGETYVAKTSMNVRYSPEVNGTNKVGGLRKGAEFTAVGRTGNNWLLVAQNGVTVGYVSGKPQYVGPTSEQLAMMRDEGIDLDALDQEAVAAGIDLDGISLDGLDLDKVEVAAETECRTVDYDITSAKGNGAASFKACKGADGAWELS